MADKRQQKISLTRALTLEIIDTDERREQTVHLLDDHLPHLAADIENLMFEQEAKLYYELFTENQHPKIRVILKLKKFEHEVVIHLSSKKACFVIGSERTGEPSSSALNATSILKTLLLKVKDI